jgi:hypothetical protein
VSTHSFVVRYRSKDGHTLLGGVMQGGTSRFQTEEMAQMRADTIIETNGSERVECEIVRVETYPEIFIHCGSHAQAIGGLCHRCHKLLTRTDAVEAE